MKAFVRFCLTLCLGLLVGGGVMKFWTSYTSKSTKTSPPLTEAPIASPAPSPITLMPTIVSFYQSPFTLEERTAALLALIDEMEVDTYAQRWMQRAEALVRFDAQETLFWWRVASANALCPDADFALGCAGERYYGGESVTEIAEYAQQAYIRALTQGSAPAFLRLKMLQTRASLPSFEGVDSPEADFYRGLYAAAGYLEPISMSKAAQCWLRAAEAGHVKAAVFLGIHYYREHQQTAACEMFERVLEQSRVARLWLAYVLLQPERTEEERTRAFNLLTELEQGEHDTPYVNFLLGCFTLRYDVVGEEAPVSYFREASETYFPMADFVLGICTFYGLGGAEQNKAVAVTWLTKAAKNHLVYAQIFLSLLYANGDGVAVDLEAARQWRSAATRILNGLKQGE